MIEIIKANTQFNSYDTTVADEIVTLTATIGKSYELRNSGSGDNTLTVNYGVESIVLHDGESAMFTFDGSSWTIFTTVDIQDQIDVIDDTLTNLTASDIPIVDAGDYYTADNIEAALQEVTGGIIAFTASVSVTILPSTRNIVYDASGILDNEQVLTFVKGTGSDRRNVVQVYNGSEFNMIVTDGTTEYSLLAGAYANFFFQGDDLEQEVSASEGGGGSAVVGDVKFTLSEVESNGWLNAKYQAISQSVYAELFKMVGHGYAKNSTDAIAAQAASTFHIPDGSFLFPRAGVYTYNIADTAINTSTDRITITAHGLPTDGSINGRPIKLMRYPGQSPTMPIGVGYTEYDQNYIRVIDANTIELYGTEAHAVDTSGTTGRVDWSSAGSGTFKLTTAGCYQADQMQGHWHKVDKSNLFVPGSTAVRSGFMGDTTTGIAPSTYINAKQIVSDDTNGTPRTGNETRPSNVSLNMQIKAIGSSVSTGEAYDAVAWDSGWVANSDWTAKTLLVHHNLNTALPSLVIKILLSETGSDDDSFEINPNDDAGSGVNSTGMTIYNINANSFKVVVGSGGVRFINEIGGSSILNTQSWYYKVKLYKPSLFAVTKTSSLVTVTSSQSVAIETVEKIVTIPDSVVTSLDLTLTAGAGIDISNGIWIKNKSAEIQHVLSGSMVYWVSPGQKVKFYFDGSDLIWASAGWETVALVDPPVSQFLNDSSLLRGFDHTQRYMGYIEQNNNPDTFVANFSPTRVPTDHMRAETIPNTLSAHIYTANRFDTSNAALHWWKMCVWHDPA